MTRQELCEMLELFAICVIQTAMANVSEEVQYEVITRNIETVADSVMVCNKRDALRYSVN